MTKELWINLPVKSVAKSKAFFGELGFSFNTKHGNSDTSASLLVGSKNIVVMLFEEPMFKGFVQNEISDTKQGNEVLLSFDAESVEEVDEMAKKAEAAGATIFGKPGWSQGWMYGFAFADPDGHRWNMLYMDMSKLPKA
ncbi:MAG: extradiol dioxygenase [Chitinophagaceae bacterium]|nr:extradiol dioxygenase [Chitinophagaceae bacterium]